MRATSFALHFATTTALPADVAWAAATSLHGVGAELPWPLRLRTDPSVATLDDLVRIDRPVVATLVVARLPVLRWTPGIEAIDLEARSFVESSNDMTWMRSWRHERRIIDLGDGRSRVEDRVAGASLVPFAALLVRALFDARHRRLHRA